MPPKQKNATKAGKSALRKKSDVSPSPKTTSASSPKWSSRRATATKSPPKSICDDDSKIASSPKRSSRRATATGDDDSKIVNCVVQEKSNHCNGQSFPTQKLANDFLKKIAETQQITNKRPEDFELITVSDKQQTASIVTPAKQDTVTNLAIDFSDVPQTNASPSTDSNQQNQTKESKLAGTMARMLNTARYSTTMFELTISKFGINERCNVVAIDILKNDKDTHWAHKPRIHKITIQAATKKHQNDPDAEGIPSNIPLPSMFAQRLEPALRREQAKGPNFHKTVSKGVEQTVLYGIVPVSATDEMLIAEVFTSRFFIG